MPDVVICAPEEDPAAVRAEAPERRRRQDHRLRRRRTDGRMVRPGDRLAGRLWDDEFKRTSRGREPLYGVGNRAAYAAGLAAYIQVLVSLGSRGQSGVGDTVRIDAAETAAAMCFPYVLQNILQRHRPAARRPGYPGRAGALPRRLGLPVGLFQPFRAALPGDRARGLPDRSALRRGPRAWRKLAGFLRSGAGAGGRPRSRCVRRRAAATRHHRGARLPPVRAPCQRPPRRARLLAA